jgi:VIT1/CCC1 family predicted Fe2+/Mn2+ transporter
MTMKTKKTQESHYIDRIGWLRAAVLGANDGILSIASILGGMIAGNASSETIFLAGLAALSAGATSMATGEYVSVSSQSDSQEAELEREMIELTQDPEAEKEELAQIYVNRGLSLELALQVSQQLTEHGALEAHARDELGISEMTLVNPLQAALASAASFVLGGILPLIVVLASPKDHLYLSLIASTLLSLIFLGAIGAKAGGVKILRPILRLLFWGVLSLAFTTIVGMIFRV